MTQVASLTASLELNSSSFVSNAEKARRAMQATANGIKADTEAMAGSLGGMERTMASVTARFQALQSLAAVGFGVAAARRALEFGRAIAGAGDEVRALEARLQGVTGEARALDLVRASADKLGAATSAVAGVFSRFALAGKDIGLTTRETQKLAEAVIALGRIGGGSAQEFEAAAQQLAQALASGKFQGDELRSVLENAPELARTLAAELGVSIGQLREMGTAGELTADVVARALLGAADEVSRKFAALPETIEQSQARWSNAWASVLDGLDEKLHASDAWKFATGTMMAGLENFAADVLGSADQGTLIRERQRELATIEADVARLQALIEQPLQDPLGGYLFTSQLEAAREKAEDLRRELIALQGVAQQDIADDRRFARSRPAAGPVFPAPAALDDVGLTAGVIGAAAPLPDTAAIRDQLKATEDLEREKTRIAEAAERERSAKRKAAATAATAEQERLASQAAALITTTLTPQEAYNKKIAEADALLRKKLLTEEQHARVATKAQEELAKATEDTGAARERQALEREAAQVYAATRTSAEAYAAELERLNKLHAAGLLDTDSFNRGVAQAGETMAEERRRLEEERERRQADEDRARRREAEGRVDNPVTAADGVTSALDDIARQAATTGDIVREGLGGAFGVASEAMTQFALTGKADIADMAASVVADMTKMIIKALIARAILAALGMPTAPVTAGATGAGTPNGQFFDPSLVTAHAKGGVYPRPALQDFENTIVDRPTLFAFARGGSIGLMGEAGKEAIMPLRRTPGGDLGVQAMGGGANVEVNIIDQRSGSAPPIERRESTGADGGRRIDLLIREKTEQNLRQGRHDNLFGERFGLRETPVR